MKENNMHLPLLAGAIELLTFMNQPQENDITFDMGDVATIGEPHTLCLAGVFLMVDAANRYEANPTPSMTEEAWLIQEVFDLSKEDALNRAGELLELTDAEQEELFVVDSITCGMTHLLSKITIDSAIACLNILNDTGKILWHKAIVAKQSEIT